MQNPAAAFENIKKKLTKIVARDSEEEHLLC
jgi:hypothetical protein